MNAVIQTGGKQYRVKEGTIFHTEKLPGEPKEHIVFDQVLLVHDGDEAHIGAPVLQHAKVVCEVLQQFKDKKIIVFKFKRRKKYRRKNGHRQQLTRLRVVEISLDGKTSTDTSAASKQSEKPAVGFESSALQEPISKE
jgi:large subunit ribosomal protein L21